MTRKINCYLFSLCFVLLFNLPVAGQVQKIITGNVVDASSNLPIAGVTVGIKGSPDNDNNACSFKEITSFACIIVYN